MKLLKLFFVTTLILALAIGTAFAANSPQKAYVEKLDTGYAYDLTVKLTKFGNNPSLGFANGGSQAEQEKALFLEKEMQKIGLQKVRRDQFKVDAWTFKGAMLEVKDSQGNTTMLGIDRVSAYPTIGTTEKGITGELVYVGKGTKQDYAKTKVKGKIVLIDVNQREDWWITYPALEAYYQGALGVISSCSGGYAQLNKDTLNTQDFVGPANQIPVLNISVNDAQNLKKIIAQGKTTVTMKSDNTIAKGESSNIVGMIPGKSDKQIIIIGDHYDTHFRGFQDDNSGAALTLSIAKAMIDSGYKPQHTIVFILHGSEETGLVDTRYDWSVGAWQQIRKLHPEWRGRALTYINFELPFYEHFKTLGIKTTFEQKKFVSKFVSTLAKPKDCFPEGYKVDSPQFTWSDDFSYSVSGVPGMVNDFMNSDFAVSRYHSQFDDSTTYKGNVAKEQMRVFGLLAMAFDSQIISPLDFGARMKDLKASVDEKIFNQAKVSSKGLLANADLMSKISNKQYTYAEELNNIYWKLKANNVGGKKDKEIENLRKWGEEANHTILKIYKSYNDPLSKLDWADQPIYGHQQPQNNIDVLNKAIKELEKRNGKKVLDELLYNIEDEWYSYSFSKQAINHMTEQVTKNTPEYLSWGQGRIVGQVDLYDTIKSLQEKCAKGKKDFGPEIAALKKVRESQYLLLKKCVQDEEKVLIKAVQDLNKLNLQGKVKQGRKFVEVKK